ncbi:3,9-dihydroxypterocarpan 6A-monooxygenase-like [Arachis duranensis]|uniref:3,9-dihydroxypterocarpan 6A-monooxygenase-like n=1 Tax=Arachis duranensis TaxID=130453 RepID=A0A6P4CEW0_ARADU|nr:3,9-dihydroxypterocarpan 6A-monooxygenase-like [Arachis duranensis]XP_025631564.1 3,9-dihydroxypterocarpan 6A-monooxygenase-like [Arachis hypogaea]QHO53549.1 3,9-dihydroxypterocarpan 6A-monooxygenase [Arachis hypogaea]
MDNFQEYIAIFSIWLAATILFQAILTKTRSSKLHLPPSPLALPIIGHFHLLQPSLHRAVHKISNRYGPLIQLYLGSNPTVFVSSAEIAKEILKTHEVCFANRPANIAISSLTYDKSDLAFAPYGTFWKFMKKLCMSELLNGRMLELLSPIREEEIKRLLETLRKKGEASEAVNVVDELLKLTNSIVMRMAISKSCFDIHNDDADKVIEMVKESALLSAKINLQDHFWFCKGFDFQGFGKKVKEVREKFDIMLEGIIQEHEEDRRCQKSTGNTDGAKDVLDALLTISEDQSSEVKITRDNIKGFLMDMFGGGTDTTAATIEWALAELINHPTAMEKARNEIDLLVTSSGKPRIVIESDIPNLPYIQAIVNEALRLHPPSPFIMRESSENCTINGFHIPARTKILINVWAIGRDPKNWDNPLEFKPERFLGTKGQTFEVRGQHFQFLPFGSGRRGCPGTSLALNVAHTSLAAMIQCFKWKVVGENIVNGVIDMEEGPSFILSRAQPLICIPKSRLVPFPSIS